MILWQCYVEGLIKLNRLIKLDPVCSGLNYLTTQPIQLNPTHPIAIGSTNLNFFRNKQERFVKLQAKKPVGFGLVFVRTYGLNSVGLQRRGFSDERIRKIHHAFRVLLNSKLNTTQALEKLKSEPDRGEDVEMLVRFIEASERGVIK